ncbi:replicative DNA helicase [Flavobacterium soyangense]|uniref:SF4 helicase domain-containing protein n=1 Tax=Flavobacterium soyangense TaxID=2023265 RepID=A0A930UFY0_9FLAO|nr:replicative DNA helicase [Flavobacterium soyangense]MBF2709750.1 hypothetical protein [Flavobacterium soyangense]
METTAIKTVKELAGEFKDRLDTISKINTEFIGIPSGFYSLDVIIKGFQTSNLVLVGGAEGMGKTAFVVSLLSNMAIVNQCPIAFFSLRIPSHQLLQLIIRQQTNLSSEKIRLGLLNEDEMALLAIKTEAFEEAPLYIVDYPFLTVNDIEDYVIQLVHSYSVKIIVIDSLESIAVNKNDKVGKVLNKRELSKISFQLKELAVKLDIAILVLFHIEDKVLGKFYRRRPLLSDIRKYAPIDTYADLILLLYNPEYYKIDEWDDNIGSPTSGEAEIIVAKNTNGILENARLQFIGSLNKFDNLSSNANLDTDLPF